MTLTRDCLVAWSSAVGNKSKLSPKSVTDSPPSVINSAGAVTDEMRGLRYELAPASEFVHWLPARSFQSSPVPNPAGANPRAAPASAEPRQAVQFCVAVLEMTWISQSLATTDPPRLVPDTVTMGAPVVLKTETEMLEMVGAAYDSVDWKSLLVCRPAVRANLRFRPTPPAGTVHCAEAWPAELHVTVLTTVDAQRWVSISLN